MGLLLLELPDIGDFERLPWCVRRVGAAESLRLRGCCCCAAAANASSSCSRVLDKNGKTKEYYLYNNL